MAEDRKMYKLMDANGKIYSSPEKGLFGGNGNLMTQTSHTAKRRKARRGKG